MASPQTYAPPQCTAWQVLLTFTLAARQCVTSINWCLACHLQVLDRKQAEYEAQMAARDNARRQLMGEVDMIRQEQIRRKADAR